jgi:hypothetical protein
MSKTCISMILGEGVEVVLDTHEGIPEVKITFDGVILRRRITRDEVNDIRLWTEIAYPRGQER